MAARLLASLAVALALLTAGAPARSQPVDLALVLAVDASRSVNDARFRLQMQGYADAFADPKVLQAIRSGPNQAIAIAMVQWTGPYQHVDVIPWTLVNDAASATDVSARIAATPRMLRGGGTSLSGAIEHSMGLLESNPFETQRRTIDISGDGSNNAGREPAPVRDAAVAAGISINGLPIINLEPQLDRYYRDNVIGGPGAFVIAVSRYEDFADAILSKLVSEIAGLAPSPRSTALAGR